MEFALNPLGTSVTGYMYLAANPLPVKAFPSTSHFGHNDKCSPDGYVGYSLFARWVPRLLTSVLVLTTAVCMVGFIHLVPVY